MYAISNVAGCLLKYEYIRQGQQRVDGVSGKTKKRYLVLSMLRNRNWGLRKYCSTVLNFVGSIDSSLIQPEDWYTVMLSDLKELDFPRRITKMQLATLLSERYPQHSWEDVFLLKGRYAQQRRLEKAIASLFPV